MKVIKAILACLTISIAVGSRLFNVKRCYNLSRNSTLNVCASDHEISNDEELKKGIAKLYDQSTALWLRVWGEHLHHGYYTPGAKIDHKQAQIDMIDRSIEWAYKKPIKDISIKKIVDVGCGVGGSSRHLVKLFGSTGTGITLSPFQAELAKKLTTSANLSHQLDFQIADALKMPFSSNSFDLTWSMESGEHMPDKAKFMKELVRVTAPGGRIILVTWCHRELAQGESLSLLEQNLLKNINSAYYLPPWVPVSSYLKLAGQLGLEDIRSEDWSQFVGPFWPAVIRSALAPWNFVRLITSGLMTIRGALAARHMNAGLKSGTVRFVVITGRKRH